MPIRRVQITELEDRAAKLEKALKLATRTAQADLDTAVFPTGRLTLENGVPVSVTDFTDAAYIYYTPYVGASIPLFNGSRWATFEFSNLTLALSSNAAHTGYHQAGKNFDLFVYREEVTGTLRLGTGPAWPVDTARMAGQEVNRLNGLFVNDQDLQIRYGSGANDYTTVGQYEATYLGTTRMAIDGGTHDRKGTTAAAGCRFLWNAYHRVQRYISARSATDNWNYSTAAWQVADNDTGNHVQYVCGQIIDAVEAFAYHMVINSTSTARRCSTGIGVDSDSVNSALLMNNSAVIDVRTNLSAHYMGHPGNGYHYLSWLEYGAGANTQTWYGDNGDATTMQSGLLAKVMA